MSASRSIGRAPVLGLVAALLLAGGAGPRDVPESRTPSFAAFPAAPDAGPAAPLRLTPADMTYRTRLHEAYQRPADFAGHHVLALWGCGAGCTMGAALDRRTGRVIWLPGTICCETHGTSEPWPDRVRYRADSRLLVLSGLRDEREDDMGAHHYVLERGRFVHRTSVPLP